MILQFSTEEEQEALKEMTQEERLAYFEALGVEFPMDEQQAGSQEQRGNQQGIKH